MLDKNTHARETKYDQSIYGGGGMSFIFTIMALSQADNIKWTILVPVWKNLKLGQWDTVDLGGVPLKPSMC